MANPTAACPSRWARYRGQHRQENPQSDACHSPLRPAAKRRGEARVEEPQKGVLPDAGVLYKWVGCAPHVGSQTHNYYPERHVDDYQAAPPPFLGLINLSDIVLPFLTKTSASRLSLPVNLRAGMRTSLRQGIITHQKERFHPLTRPRSPTRTSNSSFRHHHSRRPHRQVKMTSRRFDWRYHLNLVHDMHRGRYFTPPSVFMQ